MNFLPKVSLQRVKIRGHFLSPSRAGGRRDCRTRIHEGGEPLPRGRCVFLHAAEEKAMPQDGRCSLGVYVTNVCVFCGLPATLPRRSPSSFCFSWVYGEMFPSVGKSALFPAPTPLQNWKSRYLEELLCKRCVVSPVKVSGCPSAPRVPCWSAEAASGPRSRAGESHLLLAPAQQHRPSALSPSVTLTTRRIKCVLYSERPPCVLAFWFPCSLERPVPFVKAPAQLPITRTKSDSKQSLGNAFLSRRKAGRSGKRNQIVTVQSRTVCPITQTLRPSRLKGNTFHRAVAPAGV